MIVRFPPRTTPGLPLTGARRYSTPVAAAGGDSLRHRDRDGAHVDQRRARAGARARRRRRARRPRARRRRRASSRRRLRSPAASAGAQKTVAPRAASGSARSAVRFQTRERVTRRRGSAPRSPRPSSRARRPRPSGRAQQPSAVDLELDPVHGAVLEQEDRGVHDLVHRHEAPDRRPGDISIEAGFATIRACRRRPRMERVDADRRQLLPPGVRTRPGHAAVHRRDRRRARVGTAERLAAEEQDRRVR